MSNENNHDKPRPADVVRDGQLKFSLWQNQGKERDYISAQPAKTYTDKDGNPRDTQSFTLRDLLPLSQLAETAYKRGRELERDLNRDQAPKPQKVEFHDKAEGDMREVRRAAYNEKRQEPQRRGTRRQSKYVREQ